MARGREEVEEGWVAVKVGRENGGCRSEGMTEVGCFEVGMDEWLLFDFFIFVNIFVILFCFVFFLVS